MLRINCPYCGLRDHAEFTYGGDANISRPDPNTASEEQWYDYVYLRENPRGVHQELWHHSAGCRQWLTVQRNTLTHEIIAVTATKVESEA